MPRISTFYGIVIAMYFNDHAPPHFHALYGEHEAKIAIPDGHLLEGELPRRALKLVQEWTALRKTELMANWENARSGASLATIEPLP